MLKIYNIPLRGCEKNILEKGNRQQGRGVRVSGFLSIFGFVTNNLGLLYILK